jgi:hypothetical protein
VADTVEVAVRVPVADGVTEIVTVAPPEEAMLPNEHDTVGALIEHDPCDEDAELIARDAPDNVVDTDTPVAPEGPPLATLTV